MKQVILITGASSGFGELTAKALAKSGHIVYASMRDTTGKSAAKVNELDAYAKENKVQLLTSELDVSSQEPSTGLSRRLSLSRDVSMSSFTTQAI